MQIVVIRNYFVSKETFHIWKFYYNYRHYISYFYYEFTIIPGFYKSWKFFSLKTSINFHDKKKKKNDNMLHFISNPMLFFVEKNET